MGKWQGSPYWPLAGFHLFEGVSSSSCVLSAFVAVLPPPGSQLLLARLIPLGLLRVLRSVMAPALASSHSPH